MLNLILVVIATVWVIYRLKVKKDIFARTFWKDQFNRTPFHDNPPWGILVASYSISIIMVVYMAVPVAIANYKAAPDIIANYEEKINQIELEIDDVENIIANYENTSPSDLDSIEYWKSRKIYLNDEISALYDELDSKPIFLSAKRIAFYKVLMYPFFQD